MEVPSNRVRWLAGRILYEDRRILVLDKPAGMPVHAGTGVDFGCIEALRSLSPELRAADLAHRLDRGTSGCLLVAKRRAALRQLHGLLRGGAMDKRYLALARGRWPRRISKVDASLSTRRRGGETFVRADPEGKRSLSRFRVVERYGGQATLVEVATGTGRTHQIRVHAAHAGHPLAGDPRYGDARFNADVVRKGPETDVPALARVGVRLAGFRGDVCGQFAAAAGTDRYPGLAGAVRPGPSGSRPISLSTPHSQTRGRPSSAVGSVDSMDSKSVMPSPSAWKPPVQL